MATTDGRKLSINSSLKKAFVQPFRSSKSQLKPVTTTSPTSIEPEGQVEDLPALEYGALDPLKKSIRLLKILTGREFEPIKVQLEVYDLDEIPPYIALSYMWDQGGQSKFLECQRTKVEVGGNLWLFLHQYRRSISALKSREQDPPDPPRLWIDALSIDQKNIEERSQQVSMMRDIYMGAASVTVWLGLPQESEELAFLLTRYPHLLKVAEMSTALVKLLNKTYWSRVWVVQEFVLAKTVNIWCGEFHTNAETLESIWHAGTALKGLPSLSTQIFNSTGWQLFKYRRDFRHSRKYKRELLGRRNSKTMKATFRLRDLLQSFAASQSTEVYDKIYAFLGIASAGRGDNIRPNYSKLPVELLVDVLRNQCHNNVKRGGEDNHKFLTFLRRTLGVTRMDLAKHVLQNRSDMEPHIWVLAASEFMVASVSFVSTILDVGLFVDDAEAFQEGTWRTTWTRSSMHPKMLSNQDIADLSIQVKHPDTQTILSFADPHRPEPANPGRSEILRQTVIANSTDLVIESIVQPLPIDEPTASATTNDTAIGKRELRKIISRSMINSADLHLAERPNLIRRDTGHHHERYTSFAGTNGIIGLACIDEASYEIAAGDRICVFSGLTDSNNAFIVRLDSSGKWLIAGFAIILLPAQASKAVAGGDVETAAVADMENTVCFHCHLTDLLELHRCRILDDVQMNRMLEQTLRGDSDDEVHKCDRGIGVNDVLEFGL